MPNSPRPVARPLPIICFLIASGLAACSDSTGSSQEQCTAVSSITISGLPDTLQALDATQLSASIQPASCAGETVTWSAGPGLDVESNGQVTGTHLGGPYTVTASAGGMQGTASTIVTVAPLVPDSRWALAWANWEDSADYAVDPTYASSTGGPIRSTRSATGTYAVRFPGLTSGAGQRQTVQVSAYGPGEPRRCRVASAGNEGSSFVAHVLCHDFTGALADSRFDILVAPAGSTPGRSGFVVSPGRPDEPIDASLAHSSSGKLIHFEQKSLGVFRIQFDGLHRPADDVPETVHVSAYGAGESWCKHNAWESDPVAGHLLIEVACYSATGAPADGRFTLLVLEQARSNRRLGYVWAHSVAPGSYTPSPNYNYNSDGGPNTATRSSTGEYTVSWPGLDTGPGLMETNLVTAYGGGDANYCQVAFWASNDATEVVCYDPSGNPADSRYTAIWIE